MSSQANGNRSPEAILRREAQSGSVQADRAEKRFVERADDAGLLDVAYATVDSPIGPLLVAATRRGLVRVSFRSETEDEFLEDLAEKVSPRVLELPARLDSARRQLDLYFDGKLKRFSVPLDWLLARGFQRKVLRATARIPYGGYSTYGEIAAEAGNPLAFRAAGSALGRNPLPVIVPCHRVLQAGGKIGNYGGGSEMKKFLLRLEGAIESGAHHSR